MTCHERTQVLAQMVTWLVLSMLVFLILKVIELASYESADFGRHIEHKNASYFTCFEEPV